MPGSKCCFDYVRFDLHGAIHRTRRLGCQAKAQGMNLGLVGEEGD